MAEEYAMSDELEMMGDIIEEFVVEAEELVEKLDGDFVTLEKQPDDGELLNEVFRSAHTLKGMASFLGFAGITKLSHRMEDVLNKLRRGERTLSPGMMDVLLEGMDRLRTLVEEVKEHQKEASDVSDVVEKLQGVLEGAAVLEESSETVVNGVEGDGAEIIEAEAGNDASSDASEEEAASPESEEPVKEEVPVIPEKEEEEDAGDTMDVDAFSEEMTEILQDFILETEEIIEKLDHDLVALEGRPDDLDLLNEIFRSAHTIKGTSSFLGFTQMTRLTHRTEDVLNKLRKGELSVTADRMDALLEAADAIKMLLDRIKEQNLEKVDLSHVTAMLEGTMTEQGGTPPVREQKPADAEPEAEKPVDKKPAAQASVKEAPGEAKSSPPKMPGKSVTDQTVRVDVDRLDNLMNWVGELSLEKNRLNRITSLFEGAEDVEELSGQLNDVNAKMAFITTELQTAVMKTRMLPVGKVFGKFPRMVRDLARDAGKQIDLQISGEETELDKSVVEEIGDPLVHLIRNAVDHGVEMPADRAKAGKPEKGTVKLCAEHQGNHIVIAIEDDGKGMDPEVLKKKAIEKGILAEADAERMSDRDAWNLIFAPGFSTAAKVTSVSGRGVGMDVVKTNVAKLNGIIDIDSELGVGTKILIKLPLTLAIVNGLLVKVSDEIYIIPLVSVLETVRPQPEQMSTINGREVIRLRDHVLPLLRFDEVYNVPRNNGHMDIPYVVVVALADKQIGLAVDDMMGQEEVVIKTLGKYLGDMQGIAGSAILGDGRVRLIVDVADLVRMGKEE
ncbi:MAG: chemotaxis protein CheA [Candidatus Latescibacterota bacterium]|nr:MAG: chemotaxis protein CheA [Candidatus Latescibacterota bacterium]